MKATKRTKNRSHKRASAIQAPVPPPTPEEIHLRAHQIFLTRGGIPGRELEDWLLAEYQLKRERDEQNNRSNGKIRSDHAITNCDAFGTNPDAKNPKRE